MCAETEIDLGKTAAKHHLVIGVDDTVGGIVGTANIFIQTVAYIGSLLSSMAVEVFLCAGNTFIDPSVELSHFLAHISGVGSGDVRLCAETERGHLVLQCAHIGTEFILECVVAVAVGG